MTGNQSIAVVAGSDPGRPQWPTCRRLTNLSECHVCHQQAAGGPFFPVEPSDAAELKMVRLPVDDCAELDAALRRDGIDLSLKHAQVIK